MGCRHGKQPQQRMPDVNDWVDAAGDRLMDTLWASTGSFGKPDAENVFILMVMYPDLLNLVTPSGLLPYIVNALKDTFPLGGHPCRSDMCRALALLIQQGGYTTMMMDVLLECDLKTELEQVDHGPPPAYPVADPLE